MDQTVDQNFYFNVGFVCPLCRQSIRVPQDHLKQYHRISEDAMVQRLLSLEEFSLLTVLNQESLVQHEQSQAQEVVEQAISSGCFRFECRHCGFVDDRDRIMEAHLRDSHADVVAHGDDLKLHLKLHRMEVLIQRIDEVGSNFRQQMDSFKAGDLVMAKCAGYPWWPGMILGCHSFKMGDHRVLFFNARKTTTAMVAGTKIKPYDEFEEYFGTFMKRKMSPWREVKTIDYH